jgi:hypothetical protein
MAVTNTIDGTVSGAHVQVSAYAQRHRLAGLWNQGKKNQEHAK